MTHPTPLPLDWGRMNEVARTEWLDTHRPDAYRMQTAAQVAQAPMEIAEVVARRDVRAFAEAHQRALDMRDAAARDGTSQAEQDRIARLVAAVSEKAAVKSLNAARYKMGRMEFFPNYGHPLFGK